MSDTDELVGSSVSMDTVAATVIQFRKIIMLSSTRGNNTIT